MDDRVIRDEYGQPLRVSQGDGYSNQSGVVYGQKRQQIYGQNGPIPPPMVNQNQLAAEMTMEDMRMLRDCNRESFWGRCLPFMTAANVATYMYYNKYNLGASQKRRSWAHFGVTCIAWFVGKFSYRDVCMTKIAMSTSNSPMAQKFRKQKGMNLTYSDDYVPPNQDPMYQELPADPVDPWGSSFSQDNRDDNLRINSGRQSGFLDPNPTEQDSTVTYDALRERNRRGYQDPMRRQF